MNIFKDKNILVTGGTGFIGSHLVHALIKKKAHVHTTFISSNPNSFFFQQGLYKTAVMHRIDITHFEELYGIILKNRFDYVFHLAAEPLVEVVYANPRRALETNIMGTVNVLEASRLCGNVTGIIVASSDKAYGKLVTGKYNESDPLAGDHPYEVSKSATDLIAQTYHKTYKMPVVVTRFGNIYGEGDNHFSRIIPGIMKAIVSKNTLEIRSNGTFERDYLYVKDVVAGYLLLAENIKDAQGQVYNFGSSDHYSVIGLVRLIEKILRKKIPYTILNNTKNEIPYQSLDYTKIKKSFGWKPNQSLSSTIKNILTYYKKSLT